MTTIYHNPRCSKSRQTLALIEEQGITPEIVLYLETPPSTDTLKNILVKLNMNARDIMRKGEDEYKTNQLGESSLDEEALIQAMVKYPKVIERPIVIHGEKAALGRPPENILELF